MKPEANAARWAGQDLTQGPIARTLLWFSLPIVLQMSIQPLYGTIDSIFIGHVSKQSMAAVTLANSLVFLTIALSAALGSGSTSYIARLIGAGQHEEADNAAHHSILLMILATGLIVLSLAPQAARILRLLGADPAILPLSLHYALPLLYGSIFILFNMMGAGILRAEGNSRTPLTIAIVTVLTNLVLAPPLIFARGQEVIWGLKIGFFGLGIFGAALATLLARVMGCFMLLQFIGRGRSVWSLSWKNFRWHPRHFLEILRVGAPQMVVLLTSAAVSMTYMRVLTRFGVEAVAVYGVGAQLDGLAILPMFGLMIGMIGMVGQNLGAGRLDRVKRAAWVACLLTALFTGLMGAVFILFPKFWIGMFNQDPKILELGRNYLHIVSFTYIPVGVAFVLGGTFQGLGKGMPWLWITLVRFLGVSIPLALILSPHLGPLGAWIGIASAHVAAGILSVFWIWLEFRQRAFQAVHPPASQA